MSSKIVVKIFLILNLIFSSVAVWIALMVFNDREIVKARTVLLRENINRAADNLGYAEKQSWESTAQNDTDFVLPPVDSSEALPAFTESLGSLESVASTRVEQLANTYEQVQVAKADLGTAREELAVAESELASTRTEVANLEVELSDTQGEVQVARNEASTAERETQRLQREVNDLNETSTDLQASVSKTQEDLGLRTVERDRLQELLAACRRPRSQDGDSGDWHQKTAQILAADPEWDYVVINKGEVDVLPMYLEAFVHRGETFIGKIRVLQVENTVALAEVIPGTMEPDTRMQPGDTIFF